MKGKELLLTILTSLIPLLGFTQVSDTVKCYSKKELQIIADSLIRGAQYREKLANSKKEIKLLEEEIGILTLKTILCDSTLSKSNENNMKLQKENQTIKADKEKEVKRKRIWHTTAIIAIIGDAILVTLLYLKK